MADSKAKGLVFTPDTNILLNLIFDEYAERDAIEQYALASAMPDGINKTFEMYKVSQYLFDRPFYMLLKELIRDGKVTLDISPIVYSEIINSKRLDDDIKATIKVSMQNMLRDGKNAKTILTTPILNQAFVYYIDEKYGGPERLNKKLGGYKVAEQIAVMKEQFIADILDDKVSKRDDYIYKTRIHLTKLIKTDLIKTKLGTLAGKNGQVRFMTLAETVDGKETEFRESVYALADQYRLNLGETDTRQSIPQSELNDSLITALGSRCNIPVVTNDRKGLIASKKHIHKTNEKYRNKYGVLITGEPMKLDEFMTKFFPKEVVDFSSRYTPIPRLDVIEDNNERHQSLESAVKKIASSNPNTSYYESAISKQYKDVRLNKDISLVEMDEFFGSFMKTKEYNRFASSVKLARNREKDTFKTNILSLQAEVNEEMKKLKNMIFCVQENKGKLEPSIPQSENAVAMQAQSTYRLMLIYATHIYNDLVGSKEHGKFEDYKKIVEEMGIKVIEPTIAEKKKGKTTIIDIDGVRFSATDKTAVSRKPLNITLTKDMSDNMMLLTLSNNETREYMLKKIEPFFGARFERLLSEHRKIPRYCSYHSFNTINHMLPTESDQVMRYRDNIDRLTNSVCLER